MSNFNKLPKIVWNGNTLTIAYRVDNWESYSKPRQGSEFLQMESGVETAWVVATDYMWSGDFRWIPGTDISSPFTQTGWDGSTGWRAFIAWAAAKNTFDFYPDASSGTYITSYAVDADTIIPTLEPDGTRRVRLTIRNGSTEYSGY